jgi:hypothetical protein
VHVTSTSLLSITHEMKNLFSDSLLTEDQKIFVLDNVDILYLIYGYYGNYSFVPICTVILPKSTKVFVESSFFTNDLHFHTHQQGKLQETKQTELST